MEIEKTKRLYKLFPPLISMGWKRVDVKTGFICNNNCSFCVQAHKKQLGNRTTTSIKQDLEESRTRCRGVVFTGGEVTIRGDVFDLVSYAQQLDYKVIQIQTNGRMFSSPDFCKKMILAGANEFNLALHGYCAEQHDLLTRTKGSFKQTIQGIKNLISLHQQLIINIVVVKQNYLDCPKIAELLINLGVKSFQFAFVHPVGNAQKNYDEIVPKMSDSIPFIHQGIILGERAGAEVMVEAIPPCLMKGYEKNISEMRIPETEIKEHSLFVKDYNLSRVNDCKTKFFQCNRCKYDEICEGPWKEYPQRYGNKEFLAVNDENQ